MILDRPQLVWRKLRVADDGAVRADKGDACRDESTDRVSLGIFGLSMLAAVTVAYVIGRYLTSALSELSAGASIIGAMNLTHRIAVKSKDEIGTVAAAFNDMALEADRVICF